jgi:hypothetical protein
MSWQQLETHLAAGNDDLRPELRIFQFSPEGLTFFVATDAHN